MPVIDIERTHQLGLDRARTVVEEIGGAMRDRFGMTYQWDGDALRFSGSGVTGDIAVSDNAVHVKAQLGWMLAPMKGRIEHDIQQQLDRHFA